MDWIEIILKAIPNFFSSAADIILTATPAFGTAGMFVTGLTMFMLLFMMEADS